MNVFPERVTDDKGSAKIEGGITLRDYFATAAMQAILTGNEGRYNNRWELVDDAYKVADAMIEARDR
jgi:hypothetical protein